MRTREDFHRLIESIQHEERLKRYFELIKRLDDKQTGPLWNSLTHEQQLELLVSFDESQDVKNLIRHEDARKDFDKCLNK